MDIIEAFNTRRSIRKFKQDEDVSPELIKTIMEAARTAPSWKNMQCWQYIVVRDHNTKNLLADSLHDGNPAARAIRETPVTIVVCADPSASGQIDDKDYYLLDAGISMQQMILAAHAEGLGTCWVAWFDEQKAREACLIPDSYKVVAMTPLGYPAHEPNPRPRKEPEDMVFFDKWGQKKL